MFLFFFFAPRAVLLLHTGSVRFLSGSGGAAHPGRPSREVGSTALCVVPCAAHEAMLTCVWGFSVNTTKILRHVVNALVFSFYIG
eukprot:COSAG02_NODE_17049_length_1032_cov_1.636656_2_plen_85_part_00